MLHLVGGSDVAIDYEPLCMCVGKPLWFKLFLLLASSKWQPPAPRGSTRRRLSKVHLRWTCRLRPKVHQSHI